MLPLLHLDCIWCLGIRKAFFMDISINQASERRVQSCRMEFLAGGQGGVGLCFSPAASKEVLWGNVVKQVDADKNKTPSY